MVKEKYLICWFFIEQEVEGTVTGVFEELQVKSLKLNKIKDLRKRLVQDVFLDFIKRQSQGNSSLCMTIFQNCHENYHNFYVL